MVAVVMLTVLSAHVGGVGGGANFGGMLATLSAFVTLLIGVGLLLVPRMLRRLEARADAELQTIIVAGVLFLLAIGAAKAGYSLALGAFLLGALVAEMPQRSGVEKSFAGMRDLFSSVFFVSIGMMIDLRLLRDVWPLALGLTAFVMIARPLATGFALILTGTQPRQARRAGLLLAPLGEFSFIIAQMGVGAAILPPSHYPLVVGVAIFTLLLTPLANRHAPRLLDWIGRSEPRWFQRALDTYHGWFRQAQTRRAGALAWNLIRSRLVQMAVELLFIAGVLIFSPLLFRLLHSFAIEHHWNHALHGYLFWGAVVLLVLIPLVAIWRNLSAVAMIAAETLESDKRLRTPLVNHTIKAAGALVLGVWLFAFLPRDALPFWGWVVLALLSAMVIAVFSRRLIYLHSSLQSSMSEVLATGGKPSEVTRERARADMGAGLEAWDLILDEYLVPDGATCAGQPLSQLAIPTRCGCSLMELERNGHVITTIRPDLRLYPGDKLLLLGRPGEIASARDFLGARHPEIPASDDFSGSVLETFAVPAHLTGGLSLAQLPIARQTGVRVAAIKRAGQQMLNPNGADQIFPGDELLVIGSLVELRAFRRWLRDSTKPPVPPQA
ncbi:MAG: cation:proton antiporter, partial [Candidatus Didemnitutus sp.]|nr:cation:proton antiporter [Candidatus Didemnitutus sp.]